MYRYFAYDCDSVFPNIPKEPPRNLTEVVCDQRYTSVPPSTNGEVRQLLCIIIIICRSFIRDEYKSLSRFNPENNKIDGTYSSGSNNFMDGLLIRCN